MNPVFKIILITLFSFILACGSDSESKQIKYGEFIVKGNIKIKDHDTIFDGPIEYFDTTGKLSTIINYSSNIKNGEFIDYYSNGKISQKAYYSQGNLHGIADFFDSSGKVIYESNSFYGIEVGPIKSFSEDTFKLYRFKNFEGVDLYRCGWDSSKKIIEGGSLLNYVTNYFMDLDEGKLKMSLFIYLINPPHKHITYKLFDKNINAGDSTVIFKASSKDGFFQKVYFDPPKDGHKFLWDVSAFYPSENILLKNILNEEERMLKLPTSRE
jgi:antitoxin component YwqK of YwqJK toxin-antitoxin module